MSHHSNFHRRSIRIPGYDYGQPGAYFITICTRNRQPIFGSISNAKMALSIEGRIAHSEWLRTGVLRPEVRLDRFVIMPDHFHAIIHLHPEDIEERQHRAPTREQFGVPVKGSLGTIVRSYKSAVTWHVNRFHKMKGVSVWQRNYYERIIRNEHELNRTRRYIFENPRRWEVRARRRRARTG